MSVVQLLEKENKNLTEKKMSVIVVQCYEIVYKVLCFIKKKIETKQQIVLFVVLLKSVSYLNEEKEDHQFVTDCISFHELE